jgi:hypothetical protein
MVRAHPRRVSLPGLLLLCIAAGSCGGDSPVGPNAEIEFLVGDWDATRFIVQSKANPGTAPDLIKTLGAKFSLNVQPSGQYTAVLAYQGTSFVEIGLLDVDGSEVVFHVAVPEPPTTNRSHFTTPAPGKLTLVGDTKFAFVSGADPQPAIATIDISKR